MVEFHEGFFRHNEHTSRPNKKTWLQELGMPQPNPTEDDLKWQKKCDTWFTKRKSSIIQNQLRNAITQKNDYRVWSILDLRQKQNSPDGIISSLTSPDGYARDYKFIELALDKSNTNICEMVGSFLYPQTDMWTSGNKSKRLSQINLDIHIKWLKNDARSFEFYTLSIIVEKGSIDHLDQFVKYGGDITQDNNSALLDAIKKQGLEFIKAMINHGANPFARNKAAIKVAKEHGKLDIAVYLTSYIENKTAQARAENARNTPSTPEWSVVSDTTAEYIEPAGASGISLVYNINFDTEMVTTIPKKDAILGGAAQQPFNFFQKRTMIATAHQKISGEGHTLKSLAEIFNDSAEFKRVDAVPNLKYHRQKGIHHER